MFFLAKCHYVLSQNFSSRSIMSLKKDMTVCLEFFIEKLASRVIAIVFIGGLYFSIS